MPIYEYVCRDCKHEFEHLVRGSAKPSCPSCGGARLEKKFSVPAAHSAAGASCPARPTGTCNVPGCPDGTCNLTNLM